MRRIKNVDLIAYYIAITVMLISLPILGELIYNPANIKNIVWLIIILLIVLYVYFWRRIVKYKNFVLSARSNIDVQLSRRHNLINGLIGIIEKYSRHEENILLKKENKIEFNVLMEKYPDLKADKLFVELIDALSDCENEIAATREIFNENVLHYNKIIQTFPGNVIAVINGYEQIGFWTDEE